jgi:hypothetical protein
MFQNLSILRLIVHEVAQRSDSNVPGEISFGSGLLKLKPEARDTLIKRMVDALGSKSYCVEVEISDRSRNSACGIAKRLLTSKDTAFKTASKKLPEKLSQAQVSRNIPGGILVVMNGLTGAPPVEYCAVIKAEVHAGFHKRSQNKQVTAEFLADLFLTPQQKLYKIGIFLRSGADFNAYVYDHNMTRAETKQAAKYFYESFLGCRIADSSSAQTQAFFLNAREFFNDLETDVSQKMNYQDAMYTYLRNENNTLISVGEFTSTYLQPEHQDRFVAHMREAGFPEISVNKDLSLIRNKLKRRVMRFSSGVSLVRRNGLLNEVVRVAASDGSQTTLVITGRLEDQST